MSVSVPMQWKVFLIFCLEVLLLCPKPFYRRLWNVQTAARPAGRLSSYLLIPPCDLNVLRKKKKVNDCEVISAEIIFVLTFDKPGEGRVWGVSDIAQNLHIIS